MNYTVPNRSVLLLHLLVIVFLVTLIVRTSSAKRYDDESGSQNRLDSRRRPIKSELDRLRRSGKDFKSFYKKHFGKQWEKFYKVMLSILKLSSNTCLRNDAIRWGTNTRSSETAEKQLQEQLEERFLAIFIQYMEQACKHQDQPDQSMKPGQHDEPEQPFQPEQLDQHDQSDQPTVY